LNTYTTQVILSNKLSLLNYIGRRRHCISRGRIPITTAVLQVQTNTSLPNHNSAKTQAATGRLLMHDSKI